MAVVAHDDKGTFIGVSVIVMEGLSDPETAEEMVCQEGLALASDLAETLMVISLGRSLWHDKASSQRRSCMRRENLTVMLIEISRGGRCMSL
ncbi:hypothetical protein EJB05_55521, partial [Eragrostis curvula]